MAGQKRSPNGRCQGCNHLERVRIERLLAAGASIKAAARKRSDPVQGGDIKLRL
jgi:hypothetical protein